MYSVYDNNKPAVIRPSKRRNYGWLKNEFNTFEEALQYAKDWLGQYDCIPDNWDGQELDYSGYGDKISIRNGLNSRD